MPRRTRIESVFAGPAETQAGKSDTDLRNGKKAAGICEQGERNLRACLALFGELAKARLAHGDERDLGGGEEAVHRQDQ